MIQDQPTQTVINEQDLCTLAAVALERYPSSQAEETRIASIRALLDAAADLRRALETHTRYALVDHRGTRGSNDLRAAGCALYRALDRYAHELRQVAERHQDAISARGAEQELHIRVAS